VNNINQLKTTKRGKQAPLVADSSQGSSYPIGPRTGFDFDAQNLTPYGGLLPIATMLEKLGFQDLVIQHLEVKRPTRSMSAYQFVLAMVLGMYIGFGRLYQLRFIACDAIFKGILHIAVLPAQSTFWRFLASLHGSMAYQMVNVQRCMRNRVWAAAHVRLRSVTLDTDTTVHTVYGRQMGGRVSYAPKKKGARSYQPIFTFMAETREYIAGQLRNGDRPSAKQIRFHLQQVFRCIPEGVQELRARADSGFYCWETVSAYIAHGCHFIMVARKTKRLLAALATANWKPSPKSHADEECEFQYQPEGWPRAFRFLALRFRKPSTPNKPGQEQYQLFETAAYVYRVFVTDLEGPVYRLVKFYNERCASENLIKEANNDAGWTAHPSNRFDMNHNHFQLTMLAYNLNCWLALFHRTEGVPANALRHTTLAIARLRFLFIAARLRRHAGQVSVSYSDQYEEKTTFSVLMDRLRKIRPRNGIFSPVIDLALT